MIESSILINIIIFVCIVLILMMRSIAGNVDKVLSIVEKQTKSMGMMIKRSDRQENVLTFVTESVSIAIEFIWNHGSDEDRKNIEKTIKDFEEKD